MSEVVTYKGRLTPIDLQGEELDLWIQQKLGWTELKDYFDGWIDAICDELYEHYLYDPSSGVLYEMERRELDPESFVHAVREQDGSFSFVMSYYNGGVSFTEAAEEIFEA